METQITAQILNHLEKGIMLNFWHFLILAIVTGTTSAISAYFIEYFKKKAQHKAILEEIESITKITEQVKADFSRILDDYSLNNRLRTIAVEKRLEAYQQSYVLWLKLRRSNINNLQLCNEVVEECRIWWEHNCLYLDKEVGEAFFAATNAAANHHELTAGQASNEEAKVNRETLRNFANVLAKNLDLPAICQNVKIS